MSTNSSLLASPNKHAPRVKYRSVLGKLIYIRGYQNYLYYPPLQKPVPLTRLLSRKADIVARVYEWVHIYDTITSVLDIWSNNGFFLLQARYYGVQELHWVDIDPAVERLYSKPYMYDISLSLQDYQTVQKSYDLTIALSLTHWMVGQLADQRGNKDAINESTALHTMFKKLAALTSYCAVIELVTSDDEVIVTYGHHSFSLTVQDYLDVAKEYFSESIFLWSTRFSRHVYAFYKTPQH